MQEDDYLCPISVDNIKNPVVTCDGYVYEENNILKWFEKRNKSPMTNILLSTKRILHSIFLNKVMNDVNYNFTIDDFKCPITKNIIINPVLSDDGYFYEKSAVVLPMFEYTDNYYKCYLYNKLLKRFVEMNNELINKPKNDVNNNQIINRPFRAKDVKILYLINKIKERNNNEMIKSYIDYVDDINYNYGNNFNTKLIHLICSFGNIDIIEYFINKYPMALDMSDNMGRKPIHMACKNAELSTIKYMIEKGININIYDKLHLHPLHYACQYNRNDVIKYLLDIPGIDMECQSRDLLQPIHYLCLNDKLNEMLRYIMKKGVDITVKDIDENTPLIYLAKYSNSDNMIDYMINNIKTIEELRHENCNGENAADILLNRGMIYSHNYIIARGGERVITDMDKQDINYYEND